MVFPFTLLTPRENQLHCYQTPAIVVVVIMLEMADVAVVVLSTLAYLAAFSLHLNLALYIVLPQIEIHPPINTPYSFYLDLSSVPLPVPIPVPVLDRHQRSDNPLPPPFPPPPSGLPMALYDRSRRQSYRIVRKYSWID